MTDTVTVPREALEAVFEAIRQSKAFVIVGKDWRHIDAIQKALAAPAQPREDQNLSASNADLIAQALEHPPLSLPASPREGEHLDDLLKRAVADFKSLTPREQEQIFQAQRHGYVASEMSWGDEGTRISMPTSESSDDAVPHSGADDLAPSQGARSADASALTTPDREAVGNLIVDMMEACADPHDIAEAVFAILPNNNQPKGGDATSIPPQSKSLSPNKPEIADAPTAYSEAPPSVTAGPATDTPEVEIDDNGTITLRWLTRGVGYAWVLTPGRALAVKTTLAAESVSTSKGFDLPPALDVTRLVTRLVEALGYARAAMRSVTESGLTATAAEGLILAEAKARIALAAWTRDEE